MNETLTKIPNVLIIDDEESVREAIVDILELVEVQAIGACDGIEGLQLYQEQFNNVKLIVLDLSMPGLSGEETFSSIRKLNSTIPVLVTSGFSKLEIPPHLLKDTFAEYMQKPFALDSLIDRVQFHLKNST